MLLFGLKLKVSQYHKVSTKLLDLLPSSFLLQWLPASASELPIHHTLCLLKAIGISWIHYNKSLNYSRVRVRIEAEANELPLSSLSLHITATLALNLYISSNCTLSDHLLRNISLLLMRGLKGKGQLQISVITS